MANLHGLPDYQEGLLTNSNNKTTAMLLGGYTIGSASDARQETFMLMLERIICPYFQKKSFTCFICVLTIAIYFLTVLYEADGFMQPSVNSLILFGAKIDDRMDEVWRWVTPVLLHSSLPHLVFNMVVTVMMASRLEFCVGARLTVAVYVLAAVGGNLMSALMSPDVSVGNSTAIFGINGAMIAWILLNWMTLEGNPLRNMSILVLLIIVIFSLLMGTFGSVRVGFEADNWGHFGGLFTGFGLGLCILPILAAPTRREKILKYSSMAVLVFFYIGGMIGFYL